MKPIYKVASGGEMSRFMLAFKTILADIDEIDTIVFDEIDTGISGIAAQVVGEKLHNIAKKKQILCITHLPQIAANADTHFCISKNTDGSRTYTTIKKLEDKESINEIARLIDEDEEVSKKIKVHFVENYRVSYAEKLFPAADLSKQISTAGKEASGTGNMKFMLNGAPTFGTLDGANVEIVRESGEENNFIFGLKVEDIQEIQGKYKAKSYYESDASIKRVMDTLVDGTLSDGGTGDFDDLFDSLMKEGDQYFLLADFESFKKTEDEVFNAYKDKMAWAKKCFLNVCNAGIFSSDRTILQYADEIWDVKRTENK